MQTHGASAAQLLKTDEASERKTKKPKQWNAEARRRRQANQTTRRATKKKAGEQAHKGP
jgi:hypothetical protein